MRLFVIAEEIGMDHLHAALDVEHDAEADELSQHQTEKDTRGDEQNFPDQILPLEEPPNGIDDGQ